MFNQAWKKKVLAMVASLALWTVSWSGVVLADQAYGAPDDYLVDFELVRIQALLADKGFYRGPVSGFPNGQMDYAVLAFHKAADLDRISAWMPDDMEILSAWEPQIPDMPEQPDRLEVDLERQVMYLINEGDVVAILPISSGNGERYFSSLPGYGWARAYTPKGNFRIQAHIPGWRYAGLGALYRPWYFKGGFAVHGSTSVPAYPASHGCIRVTIDDADWLSERLSIGFPINVRNTIPRQDPVPLPTTRPFTDPLGMYS
jgi:lipoprotein-anchoring transpeptidase ErfK/SrfK